MAVPNTHSIYHKGVLKVSLVLTLSMTEYAYTCPAPASAVGENSGMEDISPSPFYLDKACTQFVTEGTRLWVSIHVYSYQGAKEIK